MFNPTFTFIYSTLFFLTDFALATLKPEGLAGGYIARNNSYLVSIKIGIFPVCGGAIIDAQYILTAAHCFIDKEGQFINLPYKIVASCVDLNDTKDTIEIDVEKIYVHKAFAPPPYTNDIAVLKLKKGLDLGDASPLTKVNLPTTDESYDDQLAVMGGFGWNNMSVVVHPLTGRKYPVGIGQSDNKLRFAKVRILRKSECEQTTRPYKIADSQICGKVIQHNTTIPEGTCKGDSGGPLVMFSTVIGILSTGPGGCDEHKEASKYTKVSSFLMFIENAKNNLMTDDIRVHICPDKFPERKS